MKKYLLIIFLFVSCNLFGQDFFFPFLFKLSGTNLIPTNPAWKIPASSLDIPAVGTAANNLLQLDASAKIPAVDGSLLTNIPKPIKYERTTLFGCGSASSYVDVTGMVHPVQANKKYSIMGMVTGYATGNGALYIKISAPTGALFSGTGISSKDATFYNMTPQIMESYRRSSSLICGNSQTDYLISWFFTVGVEISAEGSMSLQISNGNGIGNAYVNVGTTMIVSELQ